MKKNIHPKWYPKAVAVCACGNTFETGSTVSQITTEACSECHPFFTGQLHKFLDTAGRVDKYNQRVAAAAQKRQESADREKQRMEREAVAASAE